MKRPPLRAALASSFLLLVAGVGQAGADAVAPCPAPAAQPAPCAAPQAAPAPCCQACAAAAPAATPTKPTTAEAAPCAAPAAPAAVPAPCAAPAVSGAATVEAAKPGSDFLGLRIDEPRAPSPAERGRTRFDQGGPIFTFGASTSFVFDINQPDRQVTGENEKLYANGESEESFNIDLVQLGISGSRGRVGYGAKVDFGDLSDLVKDDIDGEVALQEMFLAIDAGFGVISAGRMPTPIGYEVVEPWANANISRSRAWYFVPISHDGAALAGQVGRVSLMGAVVNGMKVSENGMNNPDDEYGVIASAGLPIGEAEMRVSAIYSDEQDSQRFFELNAFVAGRHGPFRYGLDTTWLDGDGHGNGSGGPVPLDVSVWDVTGYGGATFGRWSGDLRLSYTDQEGTNGNYFNQNTEGIVSFTATGGYEIYEGVVLRAEYRVDSSDGDIFDDHNSQMAPGGPTGQTGTVQVVQAQLMWTPATGKD